MKDGATLSDAAPPHNRTEVEDLPTGAVFGRVAAELDRLSALIGQVEQAVPAVLSGQSSAADSRTIAALQGVDLLTQSLAALSVFLRQVTPLGLDDMVHVKAALRSVPLSELAARLKEGPPMPAQPMGNGADPSIAPAKPVAKIELF
jgi:hypothetical protein